MVTVAKGIEAPIKLLAPKGDSGSFAMLGLGDVVVPGLLIALCLRFDMGRAVLARPNEEITPRSSFSKVYFYTAIVSYILGLVLTVHVMNITGHPQPALLYLSPACILGPALMALVRGDIGLLWKWREEADDDEDERDETIEAPSKVAQMARKEAKDKEFRERAEAEGEAQEEQAGSPAEDDDSWMDNAGVSSSTPDGKRPRRRGGKKK
jgi:minor histocompatibility antigen H13